MTVTLVAAVAANGVIGHDGGLPWQLPGDLPRVKQLTMGHVLVMGRRTYDSIGRPLPGRTTVVVTRQPDWAVEGVRTASSVEQALETARQIDDEVFVLGGAEIYAGAMPYVDRMVVSHVEQEPTGDRFFPEVDWSAWREVGRVRHTGFEVVTYDRA